MKKDFFKLLQWLLLNTGGFKAWYKNYLSDLLFDLQLAETDPKEVGRLYEKTLKKYNNLAHNK